MNYAKQLERAYTLGYNAGQANVRLNSVNGGVSDITPPCEYDQEMIEQWKDGFRHGMHDEVNGVKSN